MTPCTVKLHRCEEETDLYATEAADEGDVANEDEENATSPIEEVVEAVDEVESPLIPETLNELTDELPEELSAELAEQELLDQEPKQQGVTEEAEAETGKQRDEMPQPLKEQVAKKTPVKEHVWKRRPTGAPQPAVQSKRPKSVATKKVKKKKLPSAVCCLCGEQFQTGIALAQHQKTHMPRTNTPVFPCNICGKNVKNLKIHLRQHKTDETNGIGVLANGVKTPKSAAASKSSDSSKSTGDATKPFLVKPGAGVALTESRTIKLVIVKNGTNSVSSSTDAVFTPSSTDPENGITSNEALTNSDDIVLPSLPNGTQSGITSPNNPLPPSSSVANVCPEIVLEENYEEYPLTFEPDIDTEPFGENEPSQSTQPVIKTLDHIEENTIEFAHNVVDDTQINLGPAAVKQQFGCSKCVRQFKTVERLAKHIDLHNKKVQCNICSRVVALSYKRMHDKRYHDPENNIPSNLDQDQSL